MHTVGKHRSVWIMKPLNLSENGTFPDLLRMMKARFDLAVIWAATRRPQNLIPQTLFPAPSESAHE
jgi:hypothetical protein